MFVFVKVLGFQGLAYVNSCIGRRFVGNQNYSLICIGKTIRKNRYNLIGICKVPLLIGRSNLGAL